MSENRPPHIPSRLEELDARLEIKDQQLAAFATLPDIGSFVWPDMSVDELYFDSGLRRLLGLDPERESFRMAEWFEAIHPDDRDHANAVLQRLLGESGSYDFTYRIVAGDNFVPVRAIGEVITRPDRVAEARGLILVISREVALTEQEARATAELERVNESLRLISKATSSGIWDWRDMSEDYIWASSELKSYLGYGDEMESLAWWFAHIHPEDTPSVDEAISAARESGGRYDVTFRMKFASGAYRYIRSTGMIAKVPGTADKMRLTGAITDVHDRVLAEQRLAQANQDLRSFTDLVAHDLAAPLRHAAAFANLLRDDFADELSGEAAQYLGKVSTAVDLASDMIRDLLAYAHTGTTALDKAPVSLTPLCERVRDLVTAGGNYGDVEWDIGALPAVHADPTQTSMLFQNLLSNAAKFSSHREVPRVEVFAKPSSGDMVAIVVKDNGTGFDPRDGNRLFDMFARAHGGEDFPGLGVGLANVARIVARHGGRIEARGEPGVGAEFTVWLPRGGGSAGLAD